MSYIREHFGKGSLPSRLHVPPGTGAIKGRAPRRACTRSTPMQPENFKNVFENAYKRRDSLGIAVLCVCPNLNLASESWVREISGSRPLVEAPCPNCLPVALSWMARLRPGTHQPRR